MKYRYFILGWALHFGLSLAGFLGLNAAALGAADAAAGAGAPGRGLAALETVVHFVLLQPLAHWVLEAFAVAWWSWPGLVALAALLALNSFLPTAFVAAAWRRI